MKKLIATILALVAILSLSTTAFASVALEDEEADNKYASFKVIAEDDFGNRTEYATNRFYDNGYTVDLTYNKVAGTCVLLVGYKNVALVSEIELYYEIQNYGVDSLTRNNDGLVAPVRMAKASNQAIKAGNLTGALDAFLNNDLKVEIMVFDDLLPTAYDISNAKG